MTAAKKTAAKKTAAKKAEPKPVAGEAQPIPGGPLISSVDSLREQAQESTKPARKRN